MFLEDGNYDFTFSSSLLSIFLRTTTVSVVTMEEHRHLASLSPICHLYPDHQVKIHQNIPLGLQMQPMCQQDLLVL